MDTQKRIDKATTRIFKAVFPNTTNHYDTGYAEQGQGQKREDYFHTRGFRFGGSSGKGSNYRFREGISLLNP